MRRCSALYWRRLQATSSAWGCRRLLWGKGVNDADEHRTPGAVGFGPLGYAGIGRDSFEVTQPESRRFQAGVFDIFERHGSSLDNSLSGGLDRLKGVMDSVDGSRGGLFRTPTIAPVPNPGLSTPTFAPVPNPANSPLFPAPTLAIPGRRFGGPVVAGRDYIVGENGEERVRFAQNGFVFPNARDGGGSNDNDELLRALLHELQDLNRKQSDNTAAIKRLETTVAELQRPAKDLAKAANDARINRPLAGETAFG